MGYHVSFTGRVGVQMTGFVIILEECDSQEFLVPPSYDVVSLEVEAPESPVQP